VRRAIRTALVVLTVVVLVDLVAGAVLAGTGVLTPEDRGDLAGLEAEATAEMAASPVMRDEPWAAGYAEELAAFQEDALDYVPYLVAGSHEFHGRYLNTTATERRTYQPATTGRPLRVAFFGGSVIFGIGQRDDHTVPSEFARVAEAAGVDVEVHNYGFPRWVLWQEAQYLERMLARDGPYDLVLFLDGFNELFVQGQQPSEDPTHHGAAALEPYVADYHEQHETTFTVADGLDELAEAYHRASAAWNLVDRFTDAPDVPTQPQAGGVEERAMAVYARSVQLAADIAEDGGTPVRFFWQPVRDGWSDDVLGRLPPEVTDLSHVFDGRQDELYFDPVHTDEAGARLLAEAMWDEVADELGSGPTADP
jgi:lysophospholipase L1-like esterase